MQSILMPSLLPNHARPDRVRQAGQAGGACGRPRRRGKERAMRRLGVLAGLIALGLGVSLGDGAPLDPKTRAFQVKVDPLRAVEYWGKFAAGQRVLTIAAGNGASALGL